MSDDLKQKKSDYLLELGLEEQMATDEEIQRYIELEKSQPPHQFSKRHQRRMKKLFKMVRKMENREKYRRRRIHMAAGFIVFFLVAGVMATQVEAFRLPLMRVFLQIKKESTLFGVMTENDQSVTENYKEYEPQYIPDDFYVEKVEEKAGFFYIKYRNDNGTQNYTFYYSDRTRSFALDTEDAMVVSQIINGRETQIAEKEGKVGILMQGTNDEGVYYLSGNIDVDTAIKVMESIDD